MEVIIGFLSLVLIAAMLGIVVVILFSVFLRRKPKDRRRADEGRNSDTSMLFFPHMFSGDSGGSSMHTTHASSHMPDSSHDSGSSSWFSGDSGGSFGGDFGGGGGDCGGGGGGG
ncbi:MAG TPA: hypothetical protein DIT64_21610, partial [Verrucomicrobiales bacterium]|nr:hypothetical protein [Verrucomicrobiales bacterium]